MSYISFPFGFNYIAPEALDSRFVVEDKAALNDLIESGGVYAGLKVYVKAENQFYSYINTEEGLGWVEDAQKIEIPATTNIFTCSASPVEETQLIEKSKIKVPEEMSVKVGDLLLTQNGFIYQVTVLDTMGVSATKFTSVVGPKGADGVSGKDGANATITGVTASVSNSIGDPKVIVSVGGTPTQRSFNFSFSGLKGEDGRGLTIRSSRAQCSVIGDGYIDDNGHLKVLTALPDAFTDAGEVKGPQGEQGTPGKSAYQIAVDAGFVGDEAKWLESLKGEAGKDGAAGAQGPAGPQGPKGEDGSKGQDGVNGYTFTPAVSEEGVISWTNDGGLENPEAISIKGIQGVQGETGPQGPTGPKGETGATGATPEITIKVNSIGADETATVTKEGTKENVTYTFNLPKGEKGATGDSGAQGIQGPAGPQGPTGSKGETGAAAGFGEITVDNTNANRTGVASVAVEVDPDSPDTAKKFKFTFANLKGIQGEQGPKGETGSQGPAGKDGTGVTIKGSYESEEALKAAHATGEMGDSYIVGTALYVWDLTNSSWKNVGQIQGPKGDTGATGAQGPKGDTGETGLQGPAGKDGTNGTNGKDGRGITSVVSSTSRDEGSQTITPVTITYTDENTDQILIYAAKGAKGDKGDTGSQGPQGPIGLTPNIKVVTDTLEAGKAATAVRSGTDEAPIITFGIPVGAKGEKGEDAGFGTPTASIDTNVGTPAVEISASGPNTAKVFNFNFKNLKGAKGDKGDKGQDGTNGTNGTDGKSAYQIWLDAGNTGSESDFLKSLKGETGSKGDTGETGPQGPTGPKGDNGSDGAPGRGITSTSISSDGNLIIRYSDQTDATNLGKVVGTGISSIIANPYSTEEGYTTTPIEVTLTDKSKQSFDVKAKDGVDGDNGYTFTPKIDAEGNLTWEKAQGEGGEAPQSFNIKGEKGDRGPLANEITASESSTSSTIDSRKIYFGKSEKRDDVYQSSDKDATLLITPKITYPSDTQNLHIDWAYEFKNFLPNGIKEVSTGVSDTGCKQLVLEYFGPTKSSEASSNSTTVLIPTPEKAVVGELVIDSVGSNPYIPVTISYLGLDNEHKDVTFNVPVVMPKEVNTAVEVTFDNDATPTLEFDTSYDSESGKYNVLPKLTLKADATLATTATNLTKNPIISSYGSTQVQIKAGEKLSNAFTIPYASSAGSVLWKDVTNKVNSSSTAAGLMTSAQYTKLEGIAQNANNYSLPTASSSTLGGIKIGTGLAINDGVVSVVSLDDGELE